MMKVINRDVLRVAGLVLWGGCAGLASAGGIVRLAENGRPLASIVVAEKATRAAKFAAADLQWHLKKMTGADFALVTDASACDGLKILVGPSRLTKTDVGALVGQQNVVDIREDSIELVGRDAEDFGNVAFAEKDGAIRYGGIPGRYDEQGTMYAVYEFLEKNCGVTWADATEFGTLIPDKPNLTVLTGRSLREPFMAYRGGSFDYSPRPHLWKPSSPEYKAFNDVAFAISKDEASAYRLFHARQRADGELAPANHSFYWWYDRFWDAGNKRFEGKHPEYFAQGYDGKPPQMCYSNPEMIRITVADIRAYLDNGGYTNTYSGIGSRGPQWGRNRYCLEPMDNDSFCKCPVCSGQYEEHRKGEKSQHSTYWFGFVKKVAEQIKVSHPAAKISTLAYMTHEGLPTDVRLPDNVEVYFCVSGNRENPRGRTCRAQMARMQEWHDAYPGMRLGFWLYNGFPLAFAHSGNFESLPAYFAHEMSRQFRRFKELNARVGCFSDGLSGEVCQYLYFALLREPDADVDALLDRYFAQYGAAARPLRKFYDIVEERYCNLDYRPVGVSERSAASFWQYRCPPNVMKDLEPLIEEAERLAATPAEKARVKLFRLGQWEWMKKGSASYVRRMSTPVPKWTAKRVAPAAGEIDKVDWKAVPLASVPFYDRGSAVERTEIVKLEMRLLHDGDWLYVELDQIRDMSKLQVSTKIDPYDDWELVCARQRAQPYRWYISSPDGRMRAASFGEVNWRQNVPASETCGDKAFFARVKSQIVNPDRWIQRFAFPLDGFLDAPVKPGETFYLNPISVLNPDADGRRGYHLGIFSPVSLSTVHTIDRAASVTLEE